MRDPYTWPITSRHPERSSRDPNTLEPNAVTEAGVWKWGGTRKSGLTGGLSRAPLPYTRVWRGVQGPGPPFPRKKNLRFAERLHSYLYCTVQFSLFLADLLSRYLHTKLKKKQLFAFLFLSVAT